jgi:general stress protein YciG
LIVGLEIFGNGSGLQQWSATAIRPVGDDSPCRTDTLRRQCPTGKDGSFWLSRKRPDERISLQQISLVQRRRADLMVTEKHGGSQRGGSGNFANDSEKASEAGKKGGEHSHGGGSQQSGSHSGGSSQPGGSQREAGGSRGASGNFAKDPEKASEAGKKGGQHSHGGK